MGAAGCWAPFREQPCSNILEDPGVDSVGELKVKIVGKAIWCPTYLPKEYPGRMSQFTREIFIINNGNRTDWSPFIQVINKIAPSVIRLITSMISNGKRTEWSTIQGVNRRVIENRA